MCALYPRVSGVWADSSADTLTSGCVIDSQNTDLTKPTPDCSICVLFFSIENMLMMWHCGLLVSVTLVSKELQSVEGDDEKKLYLHKRTGWRSIQQTREGNCPGGWCPWEPSTSNQYGS